MFNITRSFGFIVKILFVLACAASQPATAEVMFTMFDKTLHLPSDFQVRAERSLRKGNIEIASYGDGNKFSPLHSVILEKYPDDFSDLLELWKGLVTERCGLVFAEFEQEFTTGLKVYAIHNHRELVTIYSHEEALFRSIELQLCGASRG